MNEIDLRKFASSRGGKRLEIVSPDTDTPKRGRKAFEVLWVKLPTHWIERLEQQFNLNAVKLAMRILMEAHKREQVGGEIVLSSEVTRIPNRNIRARAIKRLIELELIEVEQHGNEAARVVRLLHT